MIKEGLFVVFEGPSGTGKSTQYELLRPYCPGAYFTREPGGTMYGEELRTLVQYRRDLEIDPMASALTYMASRANLVGLEIRPRLERGQTVICDRYWPSTYAYQGSEGVKDNDILNLAQIATGGLEPDYYLYINLPIEEIIRRKTGCKDIDRYDERLMNDMRYLNEVVSRYDLLRNNHSWINIDGRGSIEEVHLRVLAVARDIGLVDLEN